MLEVLVRHDVDFVLIGGMAGAVRGSSYITLDLSDPAGAPPYAALRAEAGEELVVEGVRIRVASLDHLIAMKEAAGRPKDLLMASEYRVISDELRRPRGEPEQQGSG